MLHLCTGCGVGAISDTKTSLDINECPKVSVTNKNWNTILHGPLISIERCSSAIEGKGDALILFHTHPNESRQDYVGLSKLIMQLFAKPDCYMFLVRTLSNVGQNKHI